MRSGRFVTLLLAGLYFGGAPASLAQGAEAEINRDLIHSDLPLFVDSAVKWPQPFVSEDENTIGGCASRVAFGDWELREGAEDEDVEWYRIRNYGAFHCWAVISRADERETLDGADYKPSFFVLLGTAKVGSEEIELWAAQLGARPGSDYLLLSRSAKDEGLIGTFNVLQRECPKANLRQAGSLDILRTDYCAINTQRDLRRLARRMVQQHPLGVLTLIEGEGAAKQEGGSGQN